MLRSIFRPLSQRANVSGVAHCYSRSFGASSAPLLNAGVWSVFSSVENRASTPLTWTGMITMRWSYLRMGIHSLTDTRFPKRRPSNTSRRKRASLRPPGPYAWIKYVPGEPIPSNQPNEGSVQGRNRKKRIKQHKAFIKMEAKKRKLLMQEAKRKMRIKRIERKMAQVARERAWAERLAELQKLEAEGKKKTEA